LIVGIDLGTTNSLVACINAENRPEIIINERGNRLTPSAVYFKNENEVLVGELARSQLILKAGHTVSCIKRHMGTDYQLQIHDRSYNPSEISALILRKLIKYAETQLGQKIDTAVVTVPAYFNDNQRQATMAAGELAGLNIVKLLNEPTAAALAYGAHLDHNAHILVLDIGGGTFDITLMERSDNICRVVGTGGSTTLGGIDFDNRLAEYILQNFRETTGVNLTDDPVARQQIQINAEKAKVDLSTVTDCSILIPYISMTDSGPLHLNQVIRRDEFNHLCRDLLAEIEGLIEQTMVRAGLNREWVEVVVLAGGASRMPGFQQCILDLLGPVEIKSDINPDEVVALGAAMEAGMLSGQVSDIELHDVTSHTLGVEDDGGEFVALIPANTPYPIEKSRLFTTVQDDQEEVIIHILQRDELSEPVTVNTISLGRFHLEGINRGKAGEPSIDVTFAIDRNGVLNVSALDLDTGTNNHVQITGIGYTSGNRVMARRGQSLTVL
jgi:molecular chaperone DnaK